MTALATMPAELLEAVEIINDGNLISNRQARALLERIDELQQQLNEAPDPSYVGTLEADLEAAENLAEERLEALREIERKPKDALEVISDLGGV